jgi:hypothetical protein
MPSKQTPSVWGVVACVLIRFQYRNQPAFGLWGKSDLQLDLRHDLRHRLQWAATAINAKRHRTVFVSCYPFNERVLHTQLAEFFLRGANDSSQQWRQVPPWMIAGDRHDCLLYYVGSSPAALAMLGSFCISAAIRESGLMP